MEGFYGKTQQYVEILLKSCIGSCSLAIMDDQGNLQRSLGQQTKQRIRKLKDHFHQVIIVRAVEL